LTGARGRRYRHRNDLAGNDVAVETLDVALSGVDRRRLLDVRE
jgi:hypothetical protein